MIAEDKLKDLLYKPDFTTTDKILLCLATNNCCPKHVKEITAIAKKAGATNSRKWNVSGLLGNCKGRAIRLPDGWELSAVGREYVGSRVGALAATPSLNIAVSLRTEIQKITDTKVRAFVEEGVECYEHRFFRAAVVLTWIGAVAVLYDRVVSSHLVQFNAAATLRNAKWKPAINGDGLAKMGEKDFLQILEDIGMIGKSVKQTLERQLQLRNGCGHPNEMLISENVAAAHIEVLILNVFSVS